jgi:hypothetical protein
MNKSNTLRFAMYGACLGLLDAAFLEIGLWTQVDMSGPAGGRFIGGTIARAILFLLSGFRNHFVRVFS